MAYLLLILDIFAVLLFLATIRAIRDRRRRAGLPYPPGPRPLPIIGNILTIPREYSWLKYAQFSKTYGNILSFSVLGQVMVVLNTAEAARDLLEKRGGIYPDRPRLVTALMKVMGWEWQLPNARSGDDRWRHGRRMLDRGLRPAAIASYRPVLQARMNLLLSRLLAKPHQWEAHFELYQGGLILALTYGYEAHEREDRMIDTAKRMIKFSKELTLPGVLLLDRVPLLRHIPEWLPWFSFKSLLRTGRALGNETLYPPIKFVKESMLNGTALPSLALESFQEVENQKLSGFERNKAEDVIAGALGSMYLAGADTTISSMKSFLVAMLLHPDIQKRAQEELDSVVGRDRLPTFEHRPRLPFVDAVCKEVLRWRPVVPLGVPHAPTKNDVYAGFFIPKGAIVIGNIWAILHDPTVYPEPDIFKPERFLNPDGSLRDDPILMSAFGFGKRICPGRHLVDAALFLWVASLLSTFNIERARDCGDKLSDYTSTYTGTPISVPKTVPCSFIPRDQKAQDLILADAMLCSIHLMLERERGGRMWDEPC